MKVWQLTSPHHIEHAVAPDLKLSAGKVKVKVTKALLSESDVCVFTNRALGNDPGRGFLWSGVSAAGRGVVLGFLCG